MEVVKELVEFITLACGLFKQMVALDGRVEFFIFREKVDRQLGAVQHCYFLYQEILYERKVVVISIQYNTIILT